MTCANPACNAESLYLRSGGIYAVDFLDGVRPAGECQIIQRRVIWLCDTCTGLFAVETWRPPGEQLRPSRRSLARKNGSRQQPGPGASWN